MRWTWPAILLLTACASAADPTPTASPSADPTISASTAPSTSTVAAASAVDGAAGDGQTTDTTEANGAADVAVLPEGFSTSGASVSMPDGTTCELCVWVADTSDQRRRGLMFVTDLGPADAMVFRYPEPHTGTFWMRNTPLPLSIAFYGPDGSFLESFDMEPCLGSSCPRYATPTDFLVAVEVPQGELADFGLVPGSSLAVLDAPCEG